MVHLLIRVVEYGCVAIQQSGRFSRLRVQTQKFAHSDQGKLSANLRPERKTGSQSIFMHDTGLCASYRFAILRITPSFSFRYGPLPSVYSNGSRQAPHF